MDEVPEYTYIAICDYLEEAIIGDEVVDIEEQEKAKEEINTLPYKFEIHDYSVFNMGV